MNINGRGREREGAIDFCLVSLINFNFPSFNSIWNHFFSTMDFRLNISFFLREGGDSAIENCSKFYIGIWLPSWKSLDELIHLRIENTMPPLLLGRSTKNGNVIFPPLPSRRNLDKTPDTHHCASFSIASRLSCPLDKKKEEEEEKKIGAVTRSGISDEKRRTRTRFIQSLSQVVRISTRKTRMMHLWKIDFSPLSIILKLFLNGKRKLKIILLHFEYFSRLPPEKKER